MHKKIFYAMAFALMVAPTALSAQTVGRTVSPKAPMNQQAFRISVEKTPAKANSLTPEDYGTRAVVMTEDFSKMKTGSYGKPDLNAYLYLADPEYPWWNMDPAYTGQQNWGCSNAYPAGGAVYLDAPEDNPAGHLNTPCLDVSANGAIAWIQFDACCDAGQSSDYLILEAAETNHMGPSWDIMGDVIMPTVTDEWQTYTVYFYGGGPSSLFNFVNYYVPVYLDNIQVFTVDQYLAAPTMLPHTNYQGTSFDVNWTPVEGATDYALDVYTLNPETGERTYVREYELVKEPRYTMTNAVSGEIYYCEASAVNEQYISLPAKANYVYDLEQPKLEEVTNLQGNSYTASWNDVPTAEVYNYMAAYTREAQEDGEFVITEEDFEGLKDAEGNATGWTLENPSYLAYESLFIPEFHQAGWEGKWYAPYEGYACLDAWHYANNHGDAGLVSPELDLSKDGGRVKLSVKLCGEYDSYYDAYTQCAICLFNFNEELGDFEQSELIYAADKQLKNKWETCTVEFSAAGTKRSVIGIYAVYAPDNLYVDDLRITQQYKKGETFLDPFRYARYHEGTSIDVTVPAHQGTSEVWHRVSAVKETSGYGEKESKIADFQRAGTSDGIQRLTLSDATVQLKDDKLHINNRRGEDVHVFTLAGQEIFAASHAATVLDINVPQHGTYLVQVGDRTVKVTF